MNTNLAKRTSKILEPTQMQKERMLHHILLKQQSQITKKGSVTSVKRFSPALACVIVACILTTTALAAVYISFDGSILSFLKPYSTEQRNFLENGAYLVDKQVKHKNGTLNIKQVIGDSNLTYIFMDFTAPEGTTLNKKYYSFEDCSIDFGNGFAGYGIISMQDDDPNDNKISMVMNIRTGNGLMGQKLHLKLTNLGSADTFPGELTTSVEGEWETSFNLNFKNYSADYQVNRAIKLYNYDATIKTLSVSPISITLKLESAYTKEINQAAGSWEELSPNEYTDLYPITINYADGTAETTDVFNGMHHLGGSGDILLLKTFDAVINDKEIVSVEFFDTVITVK